MQRTAVCRGEGRAQASRSALPRRRRGAEARGTPGASRSSAAPNTEASTPAQQLRVHKHTARSAKVHKLTLEPAQPPARAAGLSGEARLRPALQIQAVLDSHVCGSCCGPCLHRHRHVQLRYVPDPPTRQHARAAARVCSSFKAKHSARAWRGATHTRGAALCL